MPSKPFADNRMAIASQVTQSGYLERRSMVLNDNGVVAPNAPPATYTAVTYKGKFFPRGMRGKIEELQIYCKDAGADLITLRYSPHPGLGPFGEVTITPLATWSWVGAAVEEMWDYDSLFIWVSECEAGVDWGYEAAAPYDGHESGDTGATWEDLAVRPFIRVVFSGETIGDTPVSGIINNIPIPNVGSVTDIEGGAITAGVITDISEINGAGYVDLVYVRVSANINSDQTRVSVFCDGNLAFRLTFFGLLGMGASPLTPKIALMLYDENGMCAMLIQKRFEFRRLFKVQAFNGADDQVIYSTTYANLLR